jgi:hypothetical protein
MPETISEKLKTERFVLATSITQATVSPGTHCVQSTPHVRLKDLIEQATIHHSSWSTRVRSRVLTRVFMIVRTRSRHGKRLGMQLPANDRRSV